MKRINRRKYNRFFKDKPYRGEVCSVWGDVYWNGSVFVVKSKTITKLITTIIISPFILATNRERWKVHLVDLWRDEYFWIVYPEDTLNIGLKEYLRG